MKPETKIEQLIERELLATRECAFKQSWIPQNWACVEIKSFAKDLTTSLLLGGIDYIAERKSKK